MFEPYPCIGQISGCGEHTTNGLRKQRTYLDLARNNPRHIRLEETYVLEQL